MRARTLDAEDAALMAPIVAWFAYHWRGVREADDVLTLAWMGLQDAKMRWRPERGEWRAWARKRIRFAVIDAVRRERSLPRKLFARARRVRRAEDRLSLRLGRRPTATELAAELGVPRETLFRWQLVLLEDREWSLARPLGQGGGKPQQEPAALVAAADEVDRRLDVARALAQLPPAQRTLVERTVLDGAREVDVARELGWSVHTAAGRSGKMHEACAHASRVRKRAFAQLAAALI